MGMAAVTTEAEYALVREAVQTLTATGQSTVSFSIDGVTHTYNASQLSLLQDRELELARRLTIRNTRKRTVPEFH